MGSFLAVLGRSGGHMRAQSLFRKLSDTLDTNMIQRIAEMKEEWQQRAAPSPALQISDVPELSGLMPR